MAVKKNANIAEGHASTEEKERCQKGKEDLSQASFKYTHFAVAGKSSYEDEKRSFCHHHMMISEVEGLTKMQLTATCSDSLSIMIEISPETQRKKGGF